MLDGAHYQNNRQVTIDTLPNEILVEIFRFSIWAFLGTTWHRLVHVCRRWKDIMLGSSRYLELKVEYCGRRPITEMPKVWQTLPIAVRHGEDSPALCNANIIAALDSKHRRRVCICQIEFDEYSSLPSEGLRAAMQKPFPELTDLHLLSSPENEELRLPYSFSGGSAPHLQTLYLDFVKSFPMRRLPLSSNNLVHLSLRNIMDSERISPERMATCVSGLTRLENLNLHFHPSQLHRLPQVSGHFLPPLTPSVLPALTQLDFQGDSYYLERLVARIDAPLLLRLCIIFFQDDDRAFVLPHLGRFISHAEKLCTHARARVSNGDQIENRLTLSPQPRTIHGALTFGISYKMFSDPRLPLSSLAQVCKFSFPPICTLEELDITWGWPFKTDRNEREERMPWLELLALFTSVKDLRLGKVVALPIMRALKELAGEREWAMLPALQSLFIEGFQSSRVVQDVVEQFVTARQLSNRFVAVHDWKR